MNNLFVYGTLKKSNSRSPVLGEAEFLGEAILEGSKWHLHDLGAFPAVVLKQEEADNPVQGELYVIDDDLLELCDSIEGHPNFYKRREAIAIMQDTEWPMPCIVYTIPSDKIDQYNTTTIHSGVWE